MNTMTALMISIDLMMFGVVHVMVTLKEGALLVGIPPNTKLDTAVSSFVTVNFDLIGAA